MYTAEDVYVEEDTDNIELEYGNPANDEGAENDENDNGDNEGDADGNADDGRKVVKVKRAVRSLPKLNDQLLLGPKGLSTINGYFKNIKYKGQGHEEEDLTTIMKIYEHWCHRLFPKFPFDHCLAKIELLGNKRSVQTNLTKMRMQLAESAENQENAQDLIQDNKDNTDDLNNSGDTVQHQNQSDPFTALITQKDTQSPSFELSEEQLERIRRNREKAEQIRLGRLHKIQEKAFNALNSPADEQLPSTSFATCSYSHAGRENLALVEKMNSNHEFAESEHNRPENVEIVPASESVQMEFEGSNDDAAGKKDGALISQELFNSQDQDQIDEDVE